MVFIIGLCLGLGAAALRSFAAIGAVGVLMVVAFLIAALVSPSGVSLVALATAIIAYNFALASVIIGALIYRKQLTA